MPKPVSPKVPPGAQPNQSNILTGAVTFIGSVNIDPRRTTKKTRNRVVSSAHYDVIALKFVDTGGAAGQNAQRLSSRKNADGTFTIYAMKGDTTAGTWIAATAACTVRWTILAA